MVRPLGYVGAFKGSWGCKVNDNGLVHLLCSNPESEDGEGDVAIHLLETRVAAVSNVANAHFAASLPVYVRTGTQFYYTERFMCSIPLFCSGGKMQDCNYNEHQPACRQLEI